MLILVMSASIVAMSVGSAGLGDARRVPSGSRPVAVADAAPGHPTHEGPFVAASPGARSPAAECAVASRPERAASIVPASFDGRAFAAAVARAEATPVRMMPGARLVFVPHHGPAGHLAAGTLRDLAATGRTGDGRAWERVVVLGPDHGKFGSRAATTSALRWATQVGTVDGDSSASALLERTGVVAADAALLAREHAVGEVAPFVARYFAGASIVPLVVRADANRAERDRIVAALLAIVDDRTAVVVSADFAHDVSPRVARAHDAATVAVLAAMDADRLVAFGDEHLDARAAAAIAMRLADGLGARRFALRDRADGSELPMYAGGPVTSYVTGYYAPP